MRLITPIFYIAFLFLLTGIAIGIEALVRSAGILGEYKDVIDLPLFIVFLISIIIFGIPLLWLANSLILRLEKIKNPTILDHFRQSLFYYLMLIYTLISWIAGGLRNTEEDGYLLLWMGISVIGIAVNYQYLLRRRKTNDT